MKRLFSKTILAAMIVSLVPVQSAQADDAQRIKGLGLIICGLAGMLVAQSNCISKMAIDHKIEMCSEKAKNVGENTPEKNQLSQSKQTWQKIAIAQSVLSCFTTALSFYCLQSCYRVCVS